MKGNRRKAREGALQILYQLDVNRGLTPSNALNYFATFFSMDRPVDEFTHRLVMGITEKRVELDSIVEEFSEHWRTDRMAVIDRNILRLGVYELYHCQDIPHTVSINEMIEIAKHFGSENSAAFINGILDKVKSKLHPPTLEPA